MKTLVSVDTRAFQMSLRRVFAGLALLALGACGGGGGGGGPTSPPPPPPPPPPPTANEAPSISGTPSTAINAGAAYSFVPTASDPDGDALVFTIENPPAWALFDSSTGTLSGLPTSADLGDYADILISVSDGRLSSNLSPFSLIVAPQELGRDNFQTEGDMFMTDNGYQSVGTLNLDTGERSQAFENSDLVLEFDEEGNLLDLFGETDLPQNLTDNVSVDAGVKAVVGLMTGAEINADEDFGITLVPDINYLVFYVGGDIDITIGDRNDPGMSETLKLETPLGGQIILITDPADPMLYRYASSRLIGAYGFGQSDNGLLPFIPEIDFPALEIFNGHTIEKGSMGIGFKVFDFFEVEGTRVIKIPQFSDIDWDAPLESPIEFKAGINGSLDFAFSILSVGLFSFDLAQTSATIDVGFDRQQAAIAVDIAPDVSWVPDWFHFVPTTEASGEAFVNGNGDFSLELNGIYASTIPAADVAGTMFFDNDSVTLVGTTVNDGDALEASISFANEETVGRIKFPEAYATSIVGDVSESLEREIANVEARLGELQEATANYEFEVSLRGLRAALPALVDEVLDLLDGIPDIVGDQAHEEALDYMRTTCTNTIAGRVCIDDIANEQRIADDVEKKARREARDGIATAERWLKNLKDRALEADDEALRDALREALDRAYENRTFSRRIKVSVSFGPLFGSREVYDETHTHKILSDADAAKIKIARDNVHLIQETSDIMISAQQIYDQLPTEEIINTVREEVNNGLRQVPIPEELGYRAFQDDRYEAFVTIDGTDHDIEINVLKPSDVRRGVSNLLKDILLGDL